MLELTWTSGGRLCQEVVTAQYDSASKRLWELNESLRRAPAIVTISDLLAGREATLGLGREAAVVQLRGPDQIYRIAIANAPDVTRNFDASAFEDEEESSFWFEDEPSYFHADQFVDSALAIDAALKFVLSGDRSSALTFELA